MRSDRTLAIIGGHDKGACVQYALGLPFDQRRPLEELLRAESIMEMAAAIELAGFDACSTTDHPFPTARRMAQGGHHTLDPLIALSFAAAGSARLQLLTNVFIAAYRNPFAAAKSIATLDAMSGGRVILGMGAGYLEEEFLGLGVPFAHRGRLLDDAVRRMQLAWTGEEVHDQGEGYRASGNLVLPRPARLPHPPIWLGGNSMASIRRVIAYGDGWMPFPAAPSVAAAVRTADLSDTTALARSIERAKEMATAAGRTRPFDVCLVPFSHPHAKGRCDPAAFVEEVQAVAPIGVTWMSLELPAPSKAAFLDNVAEFGSAALSKLKAQPSVP